MASSKIAARGDVANGLAWSYYLGYLKLVIPSMKEKIENSEFYKESSQSKGQIKKMANKIFILLPKSSNTPVTLKDADEKIEIVGQLEKLELNRAGSMGRIYRSSVARFELNGISYFGVFEFPASLLTLHEMAQVEHYSGMSQEKCQEQGILFSEYLAEILEKCDLPKDVAVLVPYDDMGEEKRPLSEVLAEEIDKYTGN